MRHRIMVGWERGDLMQILQMKRIRSKRMRSNANPSSEETTSKSKANATNTMVKQVLM